MKGKEEEGVKDEGERKGEGERKERGERMTWDCSFLREDSHRGPQDDGKSELNKRCNNDSKLAVVVNDNFGTMS